MSRAPFVWGAGTAAFQIEGATKVDGRGESIWDRFAAEAGNVVDGDTGEPACEHYYRWREDVDLMHDLKLQGYRFSVAWPRIQPEGRGPASQKGLDFYRRLAERLGERGIAPLVTLYHWDLPQALQDRGGWASREVVERFAEYARLVLDGLDGVVADWITHNEPWVTAFLGYAYGLKAPGLRDWPAALRAAHHALLAHGVVVREFRDAARPGRIGITLDLTVARPATDSPQDVAAARRLDGSHNRWFLDAVLRGSYPLEMLELYEKQVGPLDAIRDGDFETMAQPIDFLGVNFYRPNLVGASDLDPVLGLREVDQQREVTAMGWPIVPEALTELLVRLKADYGDLPLIVTENGAAFDDVLEDHAVEDARRVDFLRRHIAAVDAARSQGVDVRGYYVWSLLDNFEWEWGYGKRFGLVYVDYPTQRRVPKLSALWYRDLIASRNGD
jgi:beta-glucosidase